MSILCEAAVKKTKQTSIFVAVYRYVNLIHIKLCRAVEKKPEKKSEAAFSQTANDLSETDIFGVEK